MTIIIKNMRLQANWPVRSWPREMRPPNIIKNCQKNPNMDPIEPRSSPKAKGSLIPPLYVMVLNRSSGEKRTALKVLYMPCHRPNSERLSQGEAFFSAWFSGLRSLFSCSKSNADSGRLNSNRDLQRGQFAHLTPIGIFSFSITFEKLQFGQVISTFIPSSSLSLFLSVG